MKNLIKKEVDTFLLADRLGGDKFLSYLRNKNLRTINMTPTQIKFQFKRFKGGY